MASTKSSEKYGWTSRALPGFFSSRKKQSTYSHESLPTDTSFRVMKLLPGIRLSMVKMQLDFADFDSPPPYEAISYAWGYKSLVEKCECNGQTLLITKSLYECLTNIRHKTKPRYLWADAVW